MHYTNPHATDGIFSKSRGVLNQFEVHEMFNGGEGEFGFKPRESIPMENFLIGNTCRETAENYAQHVNQTVQMNCFQLGDATNGLVGGPRIIAFIDPYLCTDDHARVLLYDIAHDREAVAFHDLHMQVQSSPATPVIGHPRTFVYTSGTIEIDKFLLSYNGGAPHYLSTQLDVANGFPTENRFLRNTQQSKFIESAYSHQIANNTSDDLVLAGGTAN